jgi:hypothetical protein
MESSPRASRHHSGAERGNVKGKQERHVHIRCAPQGHHYPGTFLPQPEANGFLK